MRPLDQQDMGSVEAVQGVAEALQAQDLDSQCFYSCLVQENWKEAAAAERNHSKLGRVDSPERHWAVPGLEVARREEEVPEDAVVAGAAAVQEVVPEQDLLGLDWPLCH